MPPDAVAKMTGKQAKFWHDAAYKKMKRDEARAKRGW